MKFNKLEELKKKYTRIKRDIKPLGATNETKKKKKKKDRPC